MLIYIHDLVNNIFITFFAMTKIFLDGSDLTEMDNLIEMMGMYDGQTTNPSNFVQALKTERGEGDDLKFSKTELLDLYKKRVQEISQKLPSGSVSIEVYADKDTSSQEMLTQAREMNTWINNAHIKLPITKAGLETAEILVKENIRVNMTLCFNQEQAAAVYVATKGAKRGDVFISPFIGRINDKKQNGMDIVKNILTMYKEDQSDGHVMVLAASIRNGEQLSESASVGSDIATSYFAAIKEWVEAGKPVKNSQEFKHDDLENIEYQEISLDKNWQDYNISHEMTDDGLIRFANDWNALLK